MMSSQLNVPAIAWRAESLFGGRQVVSRAADGTLSRCTYREVMQRARKLAVVLARLGIQPGDRVATLCWNHTPHLEAYFGVPLAGAVLHTLNVRMHAKDLAYIVQHAEDKLLVADVQLLPLVEQLRAQLKHQMPPTLWVAGDRPSCEDGQEYEALVSQAEAGQFQPRDWPENQAAGLCYTSGTTGRPKGVLYSHRALAAHALMLATADSLGASQRDALLPAVPMFHACAWGIPYVAALVGAKLILPGPRLGSEDLVELVQTERATVLAGVSTLWIALLQYLDQHPHRRLTSLRTILAGGAAAPESLIRDLQHRHQIQVTHTWGMTELAPVGTICQLPPDLPDGSEQQWAYRARQGQPVPMLEIRAVGPDGPVAWDGQTTGELQVRGPTVAKAYYRESQAEAFTADGWFRTGDIVTIDARGTVQIHDRAKDLIKSGGEWISSVALENALMAHPHVAEAAVIGVPHATWQERPLAVIVLDKGEQVTAEELCQHLASDFPKWWLPDAFEFVDRIPRTAAGKFRKSALRERFRDYRLPSQNSSDQPGGDPSG